MRKRTREIGTELLFFSLINSDLINIFALIPTFAQQIRGDRNAL
jgi:hypothetical protein